MFLEEYAILGIKVSYKFLKFSLDFRYIPKMENVADARNMKTSITNVLYTQNVLIAYTLCYKNIVHKNIKAEIYRKVKNMLRISSGWG